MWIGMLDRSPLASLRVFRSAASAIVETSPRNLARIAVSPEEHPVGGQLMGSNPDDFPPAARRVIRRIESPAANGPAPAEEDV